jgi:predicted  nucleic acid-binding Zn-ribbon protein
VNPELRVLIELQDLEQKIHSFQKEISETPNRIKTLQDELARFRQAHQERASHAAELQKRRRAFEGEVDLLRTKLSRLKDQLMAVKTNKEYTAMLHEIQGVEGQIRGEEDKILDAMEEAEQLERELKVADGELKGRESELQDGIRKLEGTIPVRESEVAKLLTEKSVMEERVAADLLSRYRQIADSRRGIALAEARDELCSACHVRIRPQVYANLRTTENIFYCDSCNRILFLRESV